MRKTYKFKAKASKATEKNALDWIFMCQQVYNTCLDQRNFLWNQRKQYLSGYDQSSFLPELKKDFPEFKNVNAQVLQQVIERVDKSYKLFFSNLKSKNGRAGKPKFKSKSKYKSFTLKSNGWRLDGRNLYIKNVGVFKLYLSREILGDIKQITVKRDSCGDWIVFFACDNVPKPEYKTFEKDAIGIDVGVSSFLTDSDSNKVDNPKFFVNSQKALKKKQRKLSRRKKGSARRNKARKLVAKQHRKIARQRLDFHFKTAKTYVEKHGLVAVEKLNVSSMIKENNLSKHINDAGWAGFREILKFKCEEQERVFIEVNPAYTSQKCSQCEIIVKKDLSERIHNCKSCGLALDRDHNAAINVLRSAVGQTVQALTCDTSQSVA